MCMGVKSFTEESRSPLHVGTCISNVDVNVCKVTPVILHWVVSPERMGLNAASPESLVFVRIHWNESKGGAPGRAGPKLGQLKGKAASGLYT